MSFILNLGHPIFEYVYVAVISTYRFVFAGPAALVNGFNYWEISICLAAGGIFGFVFFYYFSDFVIFLYKKLFPFKKKERRFKWFIKNRKTIGWIRRTGLFVLLVVGPVVLSIPLTAFFARRWYNKLKHIIVYFCISVAGWAFVFGILARFNLI